MSAPDGFQPVRRPSQTRSGVVSLEAVARFCAGRNVALKILRASFTNDPERVARFRREAQVLASLNHLNIAQIYGLEESSRNRPASRILAQPKARARPSILLAWVRIERIGLRNEVRL